LAALWANAFTLDPTRSDAGAVATLAFCSGGRRVNPAIDIAVAWRKDPGSPVSVCHSHEAYLWLKDDELDGEATVFFRRPWVQRTIWAPFVDTYRYRLRVQPSAPLTAAEIALFRAAVFDFLAVDPASEVASVGAPPALRVGDLSVSRFNPVGTVQNFAAIACGSALVIWYLQRVRHGPVQRLSSLRLAKGLCPRCAFPVSGHDSLVCPECGQSLPR